QITCVTDRARCFDLSGEWLDYCSCESLEEILKSVQFDFISLQGAELEQNGFYLLVALTYFSFIREHLFLLDMFLYYESATHLEWSSNSRHGFSGWLSLVTPSSDRFFSIFALVGALKRNVALQELYLSENNLNGYQDSMQLGDLLKYNSTLKTLDLSNNTMSDSGLEEICDALSSQKTGLRTLILSNNHITHLGMSHLQNVLPRLKTLETLNLGKNNLENRGIHTLKESLMINRSLLQLGLASTGITCEGAVTLAEILAESPQIQRLDVRQNQVLAGGLMALSLALKINCSLIRLDLDQHLKEEKEDFLVETQKTLLSRISDLCTANATAAKGMALRPASLDLADCAETTYPLPTQTAD
ncbi:hypothetical protein cypCar_00022794, partial [Cyprinus carpio]